MKRLLLWTVFYAMSRFINISVILYSTKRSPCSDVKELSADASHGICSTSKYMSLNTTASHKLLLRQNTDNIYIYMLNAQAKVTSGAKNTDMALPPVRL